MNLKSLAHARETVAGLEARIAELEALQAKAESADAAALALQEATAAFEVERTDLSARIENALAESGRLQAELATLTEANHAHLARISELEASAQSAEVRAREI